MKLPNMDDDIHLNTYAGTGKTLAAAIEDALQEYSPLHTADTFYVVIMKVITKEVINNFSMASLSFCML